ncbi:MAG: hypothetical protein CVU38_03255 [Chloroflexi bacterium HGW-Chloroflexi-1]|nr:MAG: hypothetical protein CVU38_03255 [Chloroflexi bacterium HGW-Chloroflexi-1]
MAMSRRAVVCILLLLSLLVLTRTPGSAQGGTNRAAVVVRYPNGRVWQSCVSFNEPAISGDELLRRAGLSIIVDFSSGIGNAVCSIDGAGCSYPTEDCFCRCQGIECEYWAYFHWVGGGWQYSQVGAGGYQVTDGALEGWSWGPGSYGSSGTQPPQVAFSDICVPSTATPTPTATVTRVPPTPTPTATPVPPSKAPDVRFETTATALTSGACAVLKWITWDADRVTLNGEAVLAQDRREVCLAATQRYTLVAANAAGQTERELTVGVVVATSTPTQSRASAQSPATPGQTPAAPQPPASTETATPAPIAASIDDQVTALPAAPQPAPPRAGLALVPVARAQAADAEAVASGPTRQPFELLGVAVAQPAAALPTVIPTATPFPRRALGGEGRPTPTPILLARVPATGPNDLARAVAPAQSAGGGQDVAGDYVPPDRHFSPALLPGYASFLFTAALLLVAGFVVARRRAQVGREG